MKEELTYRKKLNQELAHKKARVHKRMIIQNEEKVKTILDKMSEKEMSMKQLQEKRHYDIMIKKELQMMKLEERLENVERISRANEHKNKKIKDKIQLNEERAQYIQDEK